jgi:dephospho-CoA kinase
MLAVAFAGKLGSGKTTVSQSLAEVLGWPRACFGDYVREAVRKAGLQGTRENLQAIGTELLEKDPKEFCSSVLLSCGWKTGQDLVIDGLRHVETIEIIRKLVHPAILRIVFITLPESTRLQRLEKRGESDVAAAELHSSEQQVASAVYARADLVIEGNKPLMSIVAELTEWIANQ